MDRNENSLEKLQLMETRKKIVIEERLLLQKLLNDVWQKTYPRW